MKKYVAYIIITLSCLHSIRANPADSITTVYQDGEFKTRYVIRVKATENEVCEVATKLIYDFHNTPGNLFNWALKDLGLQDKKKNDIIFILKTSVTDEKTGITHGTFDIIVPLITSFDNVVVDAIVSKTKCNNKEMKVSANIIYSSFLLKHGLATLTIVPLKNNEQLFITNVSIKFGWFFNIFITKRRYNSIVEWRIKKFTENMKVECEQRREKSLTRKE
ncbi:MAG: hypothetical protein PHT07_19715 [Paludibacter sp.]|nr:hypothetical protein [Paludibacter sp.]